MLITIKVILIAMHVRFYKENIISIISLVKRKKKKPYFIIIEIIRCQ